MKNHPNKKQIYDTAAGIADDRTSEHVNKHITECDICRKRLESSVKILNASDNSMISPSVDVKSRIFESYDKLLLPEEATGRIFLNRDILFKPITRSFAVAAGLLLVLISVLLLKPFESEKLLVLDNIQGKAIISDDSGKQNSQIKAGSIIETNKKSYAELTDPKQFTVKIAENSRIIINKISKGYSFHLEEGKILASIKKGADLSLSTNRGFIESTGTEFILLNNKETILLLSEGSLNINSALDNKKASAVSGNKYIFKDSLTSVPLNADEKKLINIISSASGNEFNNNISLLANVIDNSHNSGTHPQNKKKVSDNNKKVYDDNEIKNNADRFRNEKRKIKNEMKREIKREMKKNRHEMRSNSNESRTMRRDGRNFHKKP